MNSDDLDTLEHELFCDSPIAMLRLDESERIVWANHALSELIGLPSTQLLGHTKQSLPSPAHRVLFSSSRLLHLEGPGAPERWLRCDIRYPAKGGKASIRYFQDVTREMSLERDNAALVLQLDNLRQTDELTGLPNGRAMLAQIDADVSRSRRYTNPLSLLRIEMSVEASDAVADGVLGPAVRAVAQYLRGRLRWVDQIARWGDTEFLVILPETDQADAESLAHSLDDGAGEIDLPPVFDGHRIVLRTDHASWQQGDDTNSLLQRLELATPERPLPA